MWDRGLPGVGNEEMLSRTQLIKILGSSGRQLNPTSIKSGFSDGVQNKGWIQDMLMQGKSYQQRSVASIGIYYLSTCPPCLLHKIVHHQVENINNKLSKPPDLRCQHTSGTNLGSFTALQDLRDRERGLPASPLATADCENCDMKKKRK